MDLRPPHPLDYSNRPPPQPPRHSKKPLIVFVGWWLAISPFLAALLFGLFITLSNLISPGTTYSLPGDSSLTPHSEGFGMECVKLIVCVILILLFSTILWRGCRQARRHRRVYREG
ncbi:MAG TPA: hypothetical protein VIL86_09840 [Tepidisphaeraceae bacterium]